MLFISNYPVETFSASLLAFMCCLFLIFHGLALFRHVLFVVGIVCCLSAYEESVDIFLVRIDLWNL